MKANRAAPPPSQPYVSDRSAGCSCAYAFRRQTPQQKRRPPSAPPDHAGVYNADTFESASGVRFRRPKCHAQFTRNAHDGPDDPPTYTPRSIKSLFYQVTDAVRRAFWQFMSFLFPKINPSIGVSFWQWRPNN